MCVCVFALCFCVRERESAREVRERVVCVWVACERVESRESRE